MSDKPDQDSGPLPRRGRKPVEGDPLSPDLQAALGRRLKSYFDGVAAEPIPDRFAQLLEELERTSAKGSTKTG